MRILSWVAGKLRVLMGLSDASGAPMTPGHGWLLPVPVEARRQQRDEASARAARRARG
jgi:hypothetical protein